MTIRLAAPEARMLEAFCRRQLRWDDQLPVRVVSAQAALGIFTCPPMGVLVFAAVPTAEPIAPSDTVDAIVGLSSLADLLASSEDGAVDVASLPRMITRPGPAPSLQHLPPRDGWQLPIPALAGDQAPIVDAAIEEFTQRAQGLPPRAQEQVADEIWDRPAFGGLPLRALHAARQLGMLGNDRCRISAATNGPWKRLSTPRGQVFVYSAGASARLALHVVR